MDHLRTEKICSVLGMTVACCSFAVYLLLVEYGLWAQTSLRQNDGSARLEVNDPFQMQPELRYGAPACDQILTGRRFTIGYSWYFRQAKWTLEIIKRDEELISEILPDVQRSDNFRADTRIPERFRAGLNAYRKSGFDRGHLVASANQNLREIHNSETFLLSNMSPQAKGLNRHKWVELEKAIRDLNYQDNVLETYVLTCPVFYFGEAVETIGDQNDEYGIDVPVPHAFIKSVLAEDDKGKLSLWTFEMKNKKLKGDLEDYLVVTYDAEQIVGGRFWDRISAGDLHDLKKEARGAGQYAGYATRQPRSKPGWGQIRARRLGHRRRTSWTSHN